MASAEVVGVKELRFFFSIHFKSLLFRHSVSKNKFLGMATPENFSFVLHLFTNFPAELKLCAFIEKNANICLIKIEQTYRTFLFS